MYEAKTGQKQHLYNAIRQHGADTFDVSVIASARSLEDLNRLEIEAISFYRSDQREFSYNMTRGGDGVCNASPEFRKMLSVSIKAAMQRDDVQRKLVRGPQLSRRGEGHHSYGKTSPLKGIPKSQEARQNMVIAQRKRFMTWSPTPEQRLKMSIAHRNPSIEKRRAIADTTRALWQSPAYRDGQLEKLGRARDARFTRMREHLMYGICFDKKNVQWCVRVRGKWLGRYNDLAIAKQIRDNHLRDPSSLAT